MLNKLPLYAAVLVSCACSSPPEIQYPKGKSARAQLNGGLSSDSPAHRAIVVQTGNSAMNIPVAVGVQLYVVNTSERTAISVLHRWAAISKVGFSWNGDVDYSVTEQMMRIQEPSLERAIAAMNIALQGASPAVAVTLGKEGVSVNNEASSPATQLPAVALKKLKPVTELTSLRPVKLEVIAPALVSRPSLTGRLASAVNSFTVLPEDTLVVPMFIRWAEKDGLAVVLNGRRVTSQNIGHENYSDLPVLSSVRKIATPTAIEAINKTLNNYKSFRFSFDIKASLHGDKMLNITTLPH